MPCVAAATVSENGMPQTSQASRKALVAPAIADFHGANAPDRQHQGQQERRQRCDQRRQQDAAGNGAVVLVKEFGQDEPRPEL